MFDFLGVLTNPLIALGVVVGTALGFAAAYALHVLFPFHDLVLLRGLAADDHLAVVDEQARQIPKPGHPGGKRHDVQGFQPQGRITHGCGISGRCTDLT